MCTKIIDSGIRNTRTSNLDRATPTRTLSDSSMHGSPTENSVTDIKGT